MTIATRVRLAALLLSTSLTLGAANAQTTAWKIDSTHSGVEFQIRHLSVSNVRGTFAKPSGIVMLDEKDITKSSVEATIDVSTVTTGDEKRDGHLKSPEFFDLAKYPTMTFKSTLITKSGGKTLLIGNLTLGGQTKPVTLELDGPAAPQKGMGGGMVSGFSATGTLSRKDFNFGQKYGEPVLGDAVKFTIDIEMSKK